MTWKRIANEFEISSEETNGSPPSPPPREKNPGSYLSRLMKICPTYEVYPNFDKHFKMDKINFRSYFKASLGHVYARRRRQRCYDACDSVLIENNGVDREWVWNPFLSDSTVFNENRIASIIAALTLTPLVLYWARPYGLSQDTAYSYNIVSAYKYLNNQCSMIHNAFKLNTILNCVKILRCPHCTTSTRS